MLQVNDSAPQPKLIFSQITKSKPIKSESHDTGVPIATKNGSYKKCSTAIVMSQ